MSLVKVSGNASGTGTLTIAAPNTNSNYTLTLPAATGVFNTSGVANEVPAGTVSAPSIYPAGDTNTGIFFPAADTIAFTEGGAESMRIDDAGRLLVGTSTNTYAGHQFSYNPGAAGYVGAFINTKTDNATATRGFIVKYSVLSPNDGSHIFLCQDGGNTNRFFVQNNGTTGGTSDVTLKKNIETTRDGYAEDLCKLRIVKYNWNEQPDGAPKELGWIAQEIETVFPQMISTDEETGYKSVRHSVFVPMLIKAIQEQQAIIVQLQADVAALKGATA